MRVVRCVCHAVPVEGFGCRCVHKCTLIDCCVSAVLEDCCFVCLFWRSLRGSCSDSYHSIFAGLQSTLTPFMV